MSEKSAVKLTETWARLAANTANLQPNYVIEAVRKMLKDRRAKRLEAEARETAAVIPPLSKINMD